MRTISFPSTEAGASIPADGCLVNLLTLYDNDLARDRAAQTEERLKRILGASLDVRFAWASLRLLCCPEIMQSATEALRTCDIVLFYLPRGGDLPPAAKAWLAAELGRNRHQCGLLALLELETGTDLSRQVSRAGSFLSAVACRGGMDFISAPGDPIENVFWW